MNKERVIFRKGFDSYRGGVCYYAVFPDEEANPGRYAALPFYFDGYGKAVFEPFCEVSWQYYYGTVVVHKSDSMTEKLLSAIEQYCGDSFCVCERITRGRD